MTRLSNSFRALLTLVTLAALVVVLVFFFQSRQGQPGSGAFQSPISSQTPSSPCAPTPQPPHDVGIRTPTPGPSEFGTPPSMRSPSVTPLPLSRTSDLAPELSNSDKVYVYVFRCNGTYELFLIRPDVEITQAIPLQVGDTILYWLPPKSLMGHQPPGPPFVSPLNTPTIPAHLPTATLMSQPTPRLYGTSSPVLPTP
jgi:hypothetical protein